MCIYIYLYSMRLFHNHCLLWRQPLQCCHGTEWYAAGGLVVQRLGRWGMLNGQDPELPWNWELQQTSWLLRVWWGVSVGVLAVWCCLLLHVVAPIGAAIGSHWHSLIFVVLWFESSIRGIQRPFRSHVSEYITLIPVPNDFDHPHGPHDSDHFWSSDSIIFILLLWSASWRKKNT